ncbi:divalent cation tolerance protein CutA [Bacillus sp. Bva_UNVM-123]|uniref:divalent cation tolerance protein CutA n=1 Tax=Bacillus sp. Bva_UNVM-123 TaxID=2829798 RepID=UPI00391FB103
MLTFFKGTAGESCFGAECKLEFKCLYEKMAEVRTIIKKIHPYEEPIIKMMPLLNE